MVRDALEAPWARGLPPPGAQVPSSLPTSPGPARPGRQPDPWPRPHSALPPVDSGRPTRNSKAELGPLRAFLLGCLAQAGPATVSSASIPVLEAQLTCTRSPTRTRSQPPHQGPRDLRHQPPPP